MLTVSEEELICDFRKRLDELVSLGVTEQGPGAAHVKSALQVQVARVNNTIQNTITLEGFLELWMKNFADNFKYSRGMESIDALKGEGRCLIVGAGPSVTEERIEALKKFDGKIICTNKSFKRLLEAEIRPDLVVAIHATEEIASHLTPTREWMSHRLKNETQPSDIPRIVLPSTVHHSTFKQARDSAFRIYWFNPAMPEETIPNINHLLELMNGKPTFDTGGNVGTMAMRLAVKMGYKEIGLFGMEHALRPTPEMTQEQVLKYNCELDVRNMEPYLVPPSFQVYIEGIRQWYYMMKADKREGVKVWNLVDFGPIFTHKVLPYKPFEDYLEGKDET